jgi:alcohol dehydrogenase class IV
MYAEERNPIVSLLALEGVGALRSGSLSVSDDADDLEGRGRLLYGAFLAGSALGAVGMAVHHRICHVLGGTFGLAHGDANAVILPYVVAYNQSWESEVLTTVAATLGGGEPWAAVRALGGRLGAPGSLSELGMAEPDLDRAAEMVVAAGGYNPRPVETGWVRQLLGDAYEGRDPAG